MEIKSPNELIPSENQSHNIVRMAVSVEEFKKALEEYNQFKKAIITDDDVVIINGKQFLKKSYWRKVNNAFNLSVTVVSENRTELPNGDIVWDFTCEATASNGRKACGTGSCSIYEKAIYKDGMFVQVKKVWDKAKHKMVPVYDENGQLVYEPAIPNSWHNARSTAETRAYNRAVSNLVGGGEVSAEEVITGIEIGTEEENYQYQDTNIKPEVEMPQPIEEKQPRMSTPAQQKAIHSLIGTLKKDQNKIYEYYKVKGTKEMTFDMANECIQILMKELKDKEKKSANQLDGECSGAKYNTKASIEDCVKIANLISKTKDPGKTTNALLEKYKINVFNELSEADAKEIIRELEKKI